jgi:catechol 2,3-dioxygenase-like lactoylglutathione lyase family enzyme
MMTDTRLAGHVLGYSHVSIAVTDMDAALGFYRDVLGLTVDADWTQDLYASQSASLSGPRDITRRCVWLRWPGADKGTGAGLALDQMITPKPADNRAELYGLGIHHFAFWVDDIDAVRARAQAAGTPILKPHTTTTENYGEKEGGFIRSVFFRDPDGNLIQCDMRADGPPPGEEVSRPGYAKAT